MAKTTRWTGGHASSNNWSEASNWDNGVPVAGDTLEFAGTTRLTPNNNIAADTSFAAITFISGAGAFTIGGNRITVAGNITNNDDSLQTISLDMIFDATRTFIGGGNIAVTGIISGAGGLQKNDTSTLTLSGLNTYTGATTVVQGTLSINTIKNVSGGSSAVGAPTSAANGTIALSSFGGNLKYTGSGDTTDRVIRFEGSDFIEQAGTGNLKFTSAFTYTNGAKTVELKGSTAGTGEISGVIADTASGAISLSKTGTGTWTLSGVNSFTGTVTVNAGTLSTTAPNTATGAIGTASGITINSGGTISATGDNSFVGSVTSGAKTITINSGGTLTSTTNTSCHLHAVVMNGGTLSATTARADYANWNPDYGISTPGTGSTTSTISGGNIALTQTSGVVFNIGSGDTVNVTSIIEHATIAPDNGLIKSGTGTLTLSGTNTYIGATTISVGTLKLTKTYSTPSFAISSGAVLEFNTSGGNIDGGTATFSGAGTLKKTGAGSLSWSTTAATFALDSGSLIDVQAGTFTGGSNGNEVWTNNKSDLNVESGAIFDGVEANVRVNKLTGAGTIKSGFSGEGYSVFTFGVDNGTGATFTGVLVNSTALGNYTKTGTGKQTCTGINTFTGNLTIDAGGTYQHGDASNNGQLMAYNAGNIIVNGAFIRYIDGAGSYGFVKTMSGSGTFEKAGSGTWVLAVGGVGSYSGTTTVSAGDLRIEGAITGTGAVTVANGATLSGTGTIAGAIGVSSGGTVAPGSGSTTIGTLGTANVTFNATSIYSVNLDGTTPTFDKINSSGTVALGAAANTLTIASIANSVVGKVYTIIGAASLTGTFNGKAENFTYEISGRTLRVNYTATTVTLTDVTPECGEHTIGRGIMRGVGVGIM